MSKAATTPTTRKTITPFRVDMSHPYDRLPFVACPNKGRQRDFWAPRLTGDYNDDCCLGEQYAEATIPMLRDDRYLLGYIVLGILERGDKERDRGVVVGFMQRLSERLIVGPAHQLAAVRAWATVPG